MEKLGQYTAECKREAVRPMEHSHKQSSEVAR